MNSGVNKNSIDQKVFGHLDDPPLENIRLGFVNDFSGWTFFSKGAEVSQVNVFYGDRLLGTCRYGIERPDVYKDYPGRKGARYCGFSGPIPIPQDPIRPLRVTAEDKKGAQQLISSIDLSPLMLEKYSRMFNEKNSLTRWLFRLNAKWRDITKQTLKTYEPRKILIAGLGRSGTTALFFKIKNSLPGTADILFEPMEYNLHNEKTDVFTLAKILFWGPGIFAFETEQEQLRHKVKYTDFDRFDKKILIVRDPRDRLISQLLYSVRESKFYHDEYRLKEIHDILKQKEVRPGSVSVLDIVKKRLKLENGKADIDKWRKLFQEYSDFSMEFHDRHPDYFVFKYEDLIDNRIGNLIRYLRLDLFGDPVVDKQHDRVVRTKDSGDWKNWFLDEDIEFFRPLLSKYMKRYSYTDSWEPGQAPEIDPKHCTEYVRRIIRQRREEAIRKKWK